MSYLFSSSPLILQDAKRLEKQKREEERRKREEAARKKKEEEERKVQEEKKRVKEVRKDRPQTLCPSSYVLRQEKARLAKEKREAKQRLRTLCLDKVRRNEM